jgi:YcxB-like protein
MQVQFEFTQDDLIDAAQRFSARSKVVRAIQWKNLLYSAFLAWLLVFLFFYSSPVKGAILGLLAALVTAVLYPSSNRKALEKRMRKISREVLGDGNSFLCEVELRQDGVWVRQKNCQTLYEWPGIEEVQETSDSVDIFTTAGSGVVVRDRAFASPEERLRFIELARAALNSAPQAAPSSTSKLNTN